MCFDVIKYHFKRLVGKRRCCEGVGGLWSAYIYLLFLDLTQIYLGCSAPILPVAFSVCEGYSGRIKIIPCTKCNKFPLILYCIGVFVDLQNSCFTRIVAVSYWGRLALVLWERSKLKLTGLQIHIWHPISHWFLSKKSSCSRKGLTTI